MNQQKIFNFNLNHNLSNDDYFVSNSNALAHQVLLNNYNPEKYIYLKGPSKSGKTHLGKLWQKINNSVVFNHNIYDYIISQNNNIFIDNFILDLNEEKLFHVINHCYNNNLKILVTSELYTSEHQFKLTDLSSRLKSFHFVEIFDPDDELMNHLLNKLLHDRQITINNDEIFSYITKRINRTYLDIYNFVERIDHLSLSKKRQITIPLIKELL